MSDRLATWTDSRGKVWSVVLNLETADEVYAQTLVDLLPDSNDYRDVIGLCMRPRKLGLVLWHLSKSQAEAAEITNESFKAGLDSDAMVSGFEAIQKSIEIFFSGQPAVAEMIRESFAAQMKGVEVAVKALTKTMQSSETDQAIKDAVAEIERELQQSLRSEMQKGMRQALDASATN